MTLGSTKFSSTRFAPEDHHEHDPGGHDSAVAERHHYGQTGTEKRTDVRDVTTDEIHHDDGDEWPTRG